jgi:hypothetical protein
MKREHPLRLSVLPGSLLAALLAVAATPATAFAQPRDYPPSQPALGEPDDPVVRAAKDLIAGHVSSLPVVYATDPTDLNVTLPSLNMPAFRIYYGNWVNPSIFLNRRSITYKQAIGGNRCALKTLAAILVHEMAHSSTKDDKVASQRELDMLAVFLREPSTGIEEQMCLMDRQRAVRQYAGLWSPAP